MTTKPHRLEKKILHLHGKKSYGLIAKELGVNRNVVAGVIFRYLHPVEKRKASPGGHSKNKIGGGQIAGSVPMAFCAPKHLPFLGRPAGSKNKKKQANYEAENYPL